VVVVVLVVVLMVGAGVVVGMVVLKPKKHMLAKSDRKTDGNRNIQGGGDSPTYGKKRMVLTERGTETDVVAKP